MGIFDGMSQSVYLIVQMLLLIAFLLRNRSLSRRNILLENISLRQEAQIRRLQEVAHASKEMAVSSSLKDTHLQAKITDIIIDLCESLKFDVTVQKILEAPRTIAAASRVQLILWNSAANQYISYGDSITDPNDSFTYWCLQKQDSFVSWDPPLEMADLFGPGKINMVVPLFAQYLTQNISEGVYGLLVIGGIDETDGKEKGRLLVRQFNMLGRVAAVALANSALFQAVETMARTDRLTGLYNRAFFGESLDRELHKIKRMGSSLSLILIDLDNFKQFNDQHGHQAGDFVLQKVSETLQAAFRDVDICVRYGGEELAVICPDTDLQNAKIAADRFLHTLQTTSYQWGHEIFMVTSSIGVAQFYADEGIDSLLRRADSHLYTAKAAGRNCVRCGDQQLDDVVTVPRYVMTEGVNAGTTEEVNSTQATEGKLAAPQGNEGRTQ